MDSACSCWLAVDRAQVPSGSTAAGEHRGQGVAARLVRARLPLASVKLARVGATRHSLDGSRG